MTVVLLLLVQQVIGQEKMEQSATDLAKKTQNQVADLISLSFQYNTPNDFKNVWLNSFVSGLEKALLRHMDGIFGFSPLTLSPKCLHIKGAFA